ncbi:MAG: hypothetical protein UHZ05_03530 [Acutalibacteraceae bacterium]|nr:hypothetical protein [Acutalibacteraceae bacterium]
MFEKPKMEMVEFESEEIMTASTTVESDPDLSEWDGGGANPDLLG